LFGDRKPIPLVRSAANDDEPRFSFDGNWLAYNSDESGTQQVYLIPFPPSDQKLQCPQMVARSRAGGLTGRSFTISISKEK
jgi:Tol biopolymer transport system component